jgi:hypothetical protein
MKRRLTYKGDAFLAFSFTMNRGERKLLKPEEVNRGLTNHGPHTLHPISVFTRGYFLSIRPGREPWHSRAGDGGEYFVNCDTLAGHHLVAMEDDSEYHCIVPREAKFWERSVYWLQSGVSIGLFPGSFCYVASGQVEGHLGERMIYNETDDQIIQIKSDNAIIAVMWFHEPEVSA